VGTLAQLPPRHLASIIAQVFFAHIENTYFSEEWWTKLSLSAKALLTAHAANPNPYYQAAQYVNADLVPWEITSVRYVNVP
jgi:hypothetical protein